MSTTPVAQRWLRLIAGLVHKGGEPLNPSNVNRKPAEEIQPHWYFTNVSLSQPPTKGADRPVRGFVTNVSWRD